MAGNLVSGHSFWFIVEAMMMFHNVVRLMAPASAMAPDAMGQALAALQRRIGPVRVTDAEREVYGRFAGSDETRARALAEALSADNGSALLCAMGGYGTGRMIRHLPMTALRQLRHPPVLVGYSDISYLGAVLHLEAGIPFVHGPMLTDFNDPEKAESCVRLCDYLRTGSAVPTLEAYRAMEPVQHGDATGRLVGGNLSMMCCLLGTPWQSLFDGAILILEETFEFLFRLDRMLIHMREAGVFARAAGVVLGSFDRMQDSHTPFGASVRNIVLDAVQECRGPVAWGAPFGHGGANYPLPMFGPARLVVGNRTALTLP